MPQLRHKEHKNMWLTTPVMWLLANTQF